VTGDLLDEAPQLDGEEGGPLLRIDGGAYLLDGA
jgi:hypothetical protein